MKNIAAFLLCAVTTTCMVQAGETAGIVSKKPTSGRYVETDRGFLVPYEVTIPGSDVTFYMEPVPGGEFLMGSPEGEKGRDEAMEGPQRKFRVAPFWIARYEVTWGEYKVFQRLYDAFKSFEQQGIRTVTEENEIDAITAPTVLYEPEFTFEVGSDDKQPAVTITQYSAKQYSKWMSAITGAQFRLPTEAEWEYACRAGTTTTYHFGNDPSKLGEYAWFKGNTDEATGKVGLKKPNQWGLYDMHGNAAEWVLDGYAAYKANDKVLNATRDWVSNPDLDPRTVRGGSWEFEAAHCRSASRLGSDSEAWREYDPNLPKSPWWFTTDPARGVGFRLIRLFHELPREEMEVFWKVDNEDTMYDVADRLAEGRGVRGLVDKDLPEAISKLKKK